jgi:signal recognition particle subunit SRP54
MVIKIVSDELCALMGGSDAKLNISSTLPSVVMLVGLQGSGKTTNGAKLAAFMKQRNSKRPLLAACDVYRPAAIEQLQTVGAKLDIPVFQMGAADPVSIASAAVGHAEKHGNDIVFLDTAGRLHIDDDLMGELRDIKSAVNPAEILLVLDAMTGQDAVNAAEAFNRELDITGVMLTKLDGDARGGAALSVRAVTGKPVKFIGTGEKLDEIEVFHPDRMASRILGMGDVLSLIEKAERTFDEKKQQELAAKILTQKFTLDDYLEQIHEFRLSGGANYARDMLPGALSSAQIPDGSDELLAKTEAIIQSMTPLERENPSVLGSSRKKRIASGSGVGIVDINRMLKQYDTMSALFKQLSRGSLPVRSGGMIGGFDGAGLLDGLPRHGGGNRAKTKSKNKGKSKGKKRR